MWTCKSVLLDYTVDEYMRAEIYEPSTHHLIFDLLFAFYIDWYG